jgi:hypothetical protein
VHERHAQRSFEAEPLREIREGLDEQQRNHSGDHTTRFDASRRCRYHRSACVRHATAPATITNSMIGIVQFCNDNGLVKVTNAFPSHRKPFNGADKRSNSAVHVSMATDLPRQ